MGTESCSYTVVNCETSKQQVSLVVASTTGRNLINTSCTLVILTASYTRKPHDFSAFIRQLTAIQYFNHTQLFHFQVKFAGKGYCLP